PRLLPAARAVPAGEHLPARHGQAQVPRLPPRRVLGRSLALLLLGRPSHQRRPRARPASRSQPVPLAARPRRGAPPDHPPLVPGRVVSDEPGEAPEPGSEKAEPRVAEPLEPFDARQIIEGLRKGTVP